MYNFLESVRNKPMPLDLLHAAAGTAIADLPEESRGTFEGRSIALQLLDDFEVQGDDEAPRCATIIVRMDVVLGLAIGYASAVMSIYLVVVTGLLTRYIN
jgi:hypothetical protein